MIKTNMSQIVHSQEHLSTDFYHLSYSSTRANHAHMSRGSSTRNRNSKGHISSSRGWKSLRLKILKNCRVPTSFVPNIYVLALSLWVFFKLFEGFVVVETRRTRVRQNWTEWLDYATNCFRLSNFYHFQAIWPLKQANFLFLALVSFRSSNLRSHPEVKNSTIRKPLKT